MLNIGLCGFRGLDRNPHQHFRLHAERFPGPGLVLGDLGHDASAVLVRDGRVEFAVEEERLSRDKHHTGVPWLAVDACLAAGGITIADAQLSYYLDPTTANIDKWIAAMRPHVDDAALEMVKKDCASVRAEVLSLAKIWPGLRFVEHHLAHAASAFYASGFPRALVAVMDGHGEHASTTIMLGDERGLHPVATHPQTGSLGLLYGSVTAFLGFEAIEDEYKIMGLAAYGKSDEHAKFFDTIIQEDADGTIVIPSLAWSTWRRMQEWARSLGPPRSGHEPIEPRHIAIAYSLQKAVERAVLRLLERHESKLKTRHLCLAGGVALNCSMNGVIDRTGLFDDLYVQPASLDAGAALGSALWTHFADRPDAPRERMGPPLLGPSYEESDVLAALKSFSQEITFVRPDDYVGAVADGLAAGKIFGWFQGRMEFGPRALGNRSILADPREEAMRDRVNIAVKKREEFRPFAPSVTEEGAEALFELRGGAPYARYETMTIAVNAKPGAAQKIPAVVHVNGTARVQVVRKSANPRYHALIERFGQKTGVPVLMNTSFNVRGEPIVCTPTDAIRCFLGTQIDHLAIEGYVATKRNKKPAP